jgi:nitrogen-specific signal transduction histidine kinase/FixJ family two-component response regulator
MSSLDKQAHDPVRTGIGSSGISATGSQFDSPGYADFCSLFDSSSEALVIIDQAGAIHKANPRARKLLQISERGLQRKGLADFFAGRPAEQLRSLSRGQTLTASGNGAGASLPIGSPIQVTLRAVLPVTQLLLLSIEGPWTAQEAEGNQRRLEAELRAVLESVQPGILILDLQGRTRFSNPRFAELLGLERHQLEKAKDLNELLPLLAGRFRRAELVSARWRSFAAGHRGPAHDDLEILGPPARLLERFSRAIVDAEGRTVGWLEIYADVTEHRQTQAKLLQSEKMAALGQVVAGIAHELNNPLTTIMGNVQLLLGQGLETAALAEARRVYQEAERARRIVKNLLYFARENKPERSAVDVNEIVERTIALRSYELKSENIRVETELASDLQKTMADPYQLQQVILNLLMNAEHALLESRGSGLVKVCTRHLIQKTGSRIFVELSDDGPGIPADIAPRIFDPFFTTKGPGAGTGLGLSIAYGIIRQHDGEITFESHPGSGAKFMIDLPVVVPPSLGETRKRADGGRSTDARPARILVVEDEPTVAQLIVDVLHEQGHSATAVLDSREGLELLSRRCYELVICDLRMPGIDGRAFFRALQRARNPMQRRILFITGDTLAESTLEFLETNRLPRLAKPFLIEELKLAVRQQLFAKREGPKQAAAWRLKKRQTKGSRVQKK